MLLIVATATTLIELSMIGGYDPWDVLMCLRQNLVENIVDRLSETFARQPPPVQCYYNVKILVVKAALYRYDSRHLHLEGMLQPKSHFKTMQVFSIYYV